MLPSIWLGIAENVHPDSTTVTINVTATSPHCRRITKIYNIEFGMSQQSDCIFGKDISLAVQQISLASIRSTSGLWPGHLR